MPMARKRHSRIDFRTKYFMDRYLTGLVLHGDFDSLPIGGKGQSEFRRLLRDTELKLLAVKYHIDNMDRLEKRFHKEDLEELRSDPDLEEAKTSSISVPIDYEFESVLLQSRACLETFCNAVATRCGERRYSPKNLMGTVKKRIPSLERKGDHFGPVLLASIRRHYFPLYIHLSQEGYTSLRDWIAHYGVVKLGPFKTDFRKGDGVSTGPSIRIFEGLDTAASTFSKVLLHATEWLTKDSFGIMMGASPPTDSQLLIKQSDLSRLGWYSAESAYDPT